MPLINSKYQPGVLYHRHLSTIYMGRVRNLAFPSYLRERIKYDLDDFIDLDWIKKQSKTLFIISHGLEGSSKSHGVRSLANYFSSNGDDVLAINFCGCSGEPNRRIASYNSGSSDQLACVIDFVLKTKEYETIFLVGISVGGNITLKYLGEKGSSLATQIKAAIAISVPCDLLGSSIALARLENRLYLWDFLKSLKQKVKSKINLISEKFDIKRILETRTFEEFDTHFTAPANGYSSAAEYYSAASSLSHLNKITLPTLLVTARDDPFLSLSCIPDSIAKNSDHLYLECPEKGGHVAFSINGNQSWLDIRIQEFTNDFR